jgi:hypothetical protein
MARIGLLAAAAAAALIPVATINAQQLSENDIFALYCMGTFRVSAAGSAESYRTACPTGNEQHCSWMREAAKAREDGLNRVKRYLAARGYLSATQPGHVSQMELAARSGEDDGRRCLNWRMNNLQAVLERQDEPEFCKQTDKCGDLSRLPM